jgi:hypothetical protein
MHGNIIAGLENLHQKKNISYREPKLYQIELKDNASKMSLIIFSSDATTPTW